MSMLTIKSHWFNITVISVHVPTEVKLMEKKDSFYSELENVLDKIHNTGLLKY